MPPMPAASQPWNAARSSARAIWMHAAISGSRSGSAAPRAMLSSSTRDRAKGARSSTSGCTWRSAPVTPLAGAPFNALARPRFIALFCQPFGPAKSTSLRAASSTTSVCRAWSSIIFQAPSVMGARSRSRSFMRPSGCLALEASDAERPVARCGSAAVAARIGGLDADDRALGEQVRAQHLVDLRVVAAEPLEGHRGVFLLLVTVVRQDLLELLVLRGVDALVVPVDGLQLLAQRRDRAVAVDRLRAEQLRVLVQSYARRHDPSVSRFLVEAPERVNSSRPRASLLQLLPDRIQLLPRVDEIRIEVAPVVGEHPVTRAVENDQRLHRGGL